MNKSPFLISINRNKKIFEDVEKYPFTIPLFHTMDLDLKIEKPILIISGDNGTGKSTLLESIATFLKFNVNGGNKNHLYGERKNDVEEIIDYLDFKWKSTQVHDGFFMRADNFSQFTKYIDEQAGEFGAYAYDYYGGKSLNKQSHGESFLSLFQNRFNNQGIYILDEPEAALSPQRILSFMLIIKELADTGNAQFIISTHSPLLMAIPDAQFIYLTKNDIREINYKDTEHFQITKLFLDNPDRMLKHLFRKDD